MGCDKTTALLARARAGSDGARDALYARCAAKLLPIVRARMGASLREHLESDDLLQNVLLKTLRQLDRLDGADERSLMAWLARIAENEIRDQWAHHTRQRRDAARTLPLDDEMEAAASERSVLSRLIASEELARIERALESLPDAHREVIVLRKFEELRFAEIAVRMGRSEDACRVLFARAMAALTLAFPR